MADFPTQDPHGILSAMEENWSLVRGVHVVYKLGTHGDVYVNKDAHLAHPEVAERISQLLAEGIPDGSIIIGPETRTEFKLAERVAQLSRSEYVPTKKEKDVHTFDPKYHTLLREQRKRFGVDDILNNAVTLEQINAALLALGLSMEEFRVMVNRNPIGSATNTTPIMALATSQMDQWEERKVPIDLLKKPITTKLGKARNWVPAPGQILAAQFFLERLAKEDLGFRLDDGMVVTAGRETEWELIPDKGQTKDGTEIRMDVDQTFVVGAKY